MARLVESSGWEERCTCRFSECSAREVLSYVTEVLAIRFEGLLKMKDQLTVVLVGASFWTRSSEQSGAERKVGFDSARYNLAIPILKASVLQAVDLADRVCVHMLDAERPQATDSWAEGLFEQVISFNPDVVGLSCYCWSIDTLLGLAGRIRKRFQSVVVVAGGPSVGPRARTLLATHTSVDAVARGEGEQVLPSLLRSLLAGVQFDAVVGLTWRDATGQIRENPDSPPLDLALLPSPYAHGFVPRTPGRMLIETSRGCKYRCQFCTYLGSIRELRYVPVSRVVADLQWAVGHGITHVSILDTAINFSTDRLREIADAVGAADPERRLQFSYFLAFELITQEQAEILSSIPTVEAIFGIESFTPAARKAMGKPPLSPNDLVSKVQLLRHAVPITCTLVLGLPGDTTEGLEATLSWMQEIVRENPGRFCAFGLFWLAILPGSHLDAFRDRFGFRCASEGSPFVLQSNEHNPDTILSMARLSIEYHYAYAVLRLERFHYDYLAQDAPAPDRPCFIERRINDNRPCVLLYGDVDNSWRAFGLDPYDLRSAWLKAFAEKDSDLRRSFRFELATEKEDFSTLVATHRPVWIVRSCLRAPRPSDEWLAHVVPNGNNPSILLVGACSQQEAEAWMLSVPQATAATVGEAEIAFRSLLMGCHNTPGLMNRNDGNLVFTGTPELVQDLDEIPSPFQWQFVMRTGYTIAMRLGRTNPPRFWSAERIYRDIRWAIERGHNHILWLDESLPSNKQQISRWIEAIERTRGMVRHSYRLDGSQGIDILEELARLPTHTITLTGEYSSTLWKNALQQIVTKQNAVVTQDLDGRI